MNKAFYENINLCLRESTTEECVREIRKNIRAIDITDALEYLVQIISDNGEEKKTLQHDKDSTSGLWATDRPDLINDPEGVLFYIGDKECNNCKLPYSQSKGENCMNCGTKKNHNYNK